MEDLFGEVWPGPVARGDLNAPVVAMGARLAGPVTEAEARVRLAGPVRLGPGDAPLRNGVYIT